MSRLSDAIRRAQRIEAAPMGFGAARAAPKATLLVGVQTTAAGAAAAKENGAEVLLLSAGGLTAESVAEVRSAVGDAPLGAVVTSLSREEVATLHKAGLDFISFTAEAMPAEALLVEDMGYVLSLPVTPEESFLRSLEGLSLDALWLGDIPSPLTVAGQLELNKIALLGRKPLVSEVGAGASASDIECLRAAGAGLLIAAALDEVAPLKEKVMALPPRRTRREDRSPVALPRTQAAPEEPDDDDDS